MSFIINNWVYKIIKTQPGVGRDRHESLLLGRMIHEDGNDHDWFVISRDLSDELTMLFKEIFELQVSYFFDEYGILHRKEDTMQ